MCHIKMPVIEKKGKYRLKGKAAQGSVKAGRKRIFWRKETRALCEDHMAITNRITVSSFEIKKLE